MYFFFYNSKLKVFIIKIISINTSFGSDCFHKAITKVIAFKLISPIFKFWRNNTFVELSGKSFQNKTLCDVMILNGFEPEIEMRIYTIRQQQSDKLLSLIRLNWMLETVDVNREKNSRPQLKIHFFIIILWHKG